MCGIFFSLSRQGPNKPDPATVTFLTARGPDAFRTVCVKVSDSLQLVFCSSVLALRGEIIQEQPLVDPKTGSVLCWNGEAWKIADEKVKGNDSLQIFDLLLTATSDTPSSETVEEALASVSGPFAFVFYDALHSTVYYGRDRLGRRSLLVDRSDDDTLTISSISSSSTAIPVECLTECLHSISLLDNNLNFQRLEWPNSFPSINKAVPITPENANPTQEAVDTLIQRLSQSLQTRLLNIPVHGKLHLMPGDAKVAILFSGGLDCALLARLSHEILPTTDSIDLLNVAFENPRLMMTNPEARRFPYEVCPDRITGRTTFEELVRTCPGRCWRFVAIDVPYDEVLSHRQALLRLMRPHNTEMDLSIAMALYFTSRGRGTYLSSTLIDSQPRSYQTTARVLLSGLGADELFGGYSRHAAAFSRLGYPGLIDELELDFTRIGQRNLGRDDRVLSHWGREIRYPYLDEDFVRSALALTVWEKCGFRSGTRIPKHYEEARKVQVEEDLDPAKKLLRMAVWRLGMRSAAAERKRAIQFGSRTAKMNVGGGRKKGTDVLDGD